ncbi:MAG: hypothetical protein FWF44_02490, partial [Defluviitaleaceae bacterium]|nr:hypothetical protein [Defluviitaleaceae bacterium]
MINHNIIPFDRDDLRQREAFLELLTDYFAGLRFDDPGDAVPPDAVPKILEMICDMLDKGGYWVFFCLHAGEYAGFIIAQID